MKVQDAYLLKHQVNPTPLFSGSPNAGEAERGEAERLGEGCRLGLDGGGPSKRPGSEKRKSDRSSLEKNTKRWSRHDRKSNGNRTFLKCVLLHQKYVDCFIWSELQIHKISEVVAWLISSYHSQWLHSLWLSFNRSIPSCQLIPVSNSSGEPPMATQQAQAIILTAKLFQKLSEKIGAWTL